MQMARTGVADLRRAGRHRSSWRRSGWRRASRLLGDSAHDHVDVPGAARRADEPLAPLRARGLGAVSPRLLGGIGLDLVAARLAPRRSAAREPRRHCRGSSAGLARGFQRLAPAASRWRCARSDFRASHAFLTRRPWRGNALRGIIIFLSRQTSAASDADHAVDWSERCLVNC
jgi:hypothetical protein